MNIMELGAIGELVGGVAVIASLVYVGLQVRYSALQTQSVSHHAVTDSFNEINMSVSQSPELTAIFCKGNADRSSLDTEDQARFDLLCLSFLRVFETLWYQDQTGAYRAWRWDDSIAAMFSAPGLQGWWRTNPFTFPPDFRRHVESLVPDVNETVVARYVGSSS